MRLQQEIFLTLLLAAHTSPVYALEEPGAGDTSGVQETNRRLLDKWRADREHYDRLKRDQKVFGELPADKQERIRQFDQDLHKESAAKQAHLVHALERYAAACGAMKVRMPKRALQKARSASHHP